MTFINTEGMSFIGPGSEWFWTALGVIIAAVTLFGIYRTLACSSARGRSSRWRRSTRNSSLSRCRARLAVLLALRDGAHPATLPPGGQRHREFLGARRPSRPGRSCRPDAGQPVFRRQHPGLVGMARASHASRPRTGCGPGPLRELRIPCRIDGRDGSQGRQDGDLRSGQSREPHPALHRAQPRSDPDCRGVPRRPGAAALDGEPDPGTRPPRKWPTDEMARKTGAAKPRFIPPMLATLVAAPFDDPDWLFEIKWDGFRVEAVVEARAVRLWTRGEQDADALLRAVPRPADVARRARGAIVDGEVDRARRRAASPISPCSRRGSRGGERPPSRRRSSTRSSTSSISTADRSSTSRSRSAGGSWRASCAPDPRVRLSEHIEADGIAFFEAAQARGLEGIMAKDRHSPYVPGKRDRPLAEGQDPPRAGARRRRLGRRAQARRSTSARCSSASTRTARCATRARSAPGFTNANRDELLAARRAARRPTRRRSRRRRRARPPATPSGCARSSSSAPSSPAGPATAWSARRPTRASSSRRTPGRSSASARRARLGPSRKGGHPVANLVVHFEIHASEPQRLVDFYSGAPRPEVHAVRRHPVLDDRDREGAIGNVAGTAGHGINGGLTQRRGPKPEPGAPVMGCNFVVGVDDVDSPDASRRRARRHGGPARPRTCRVSVAPATCSIPTTMSLA